MRKLLALVVAVALGGGCADAPPPLGAPMDRVPGGRTVSPRAGTAAVVAEGGALTVEGPGGARTVDADVDPRVAFAPDGAFLVYARLGTGGGTDLWRVALPDGVPVRLTDWPGSEDRPVVAPDGARVAFIADVDGLASWYVIDLPADARVVPVDAARRRSNLHLGPRRIGAPPSGFEPPPDAADYAWGPAGLVWSARGVRFTVAP